MKPKIVSKRKNTDGTTEVVVLFETKDDGEVRYHYVGHNNYEIEKILRKKVFGFKDWNKIKKYCKLTHKDVT